MPGAHSSPSPGQAQCCRGYAAASTQTQFKPRSPVPMLQPRAVTSLRHRHPRVLAACRASPWEGGVLIPSGVQDQQKWWLLRPLPEIREIRERAQDQVDQDQSSRSRLVRNPNVQNMDRVSPEVKGKNRDTLEQRAGKGHVLQLSSVSAMLFSKGGLIRDC